ncbi:SpoVA/SpoVAEb family sporulation membrane protein [Desulforudis sp. 1088]|uniref:SpoVA/SpoVAEb family sporulation membrane protein n=2 Tax=Candidatus Desulforudis TaxID=471826 RepID=UPI003CEEC574
MNVLRKFARANFLSFCRGLRGLEFYGLVAGRSLFWALRHAFVVGGLLCAAGQLMMDLTGHRATPRPRPGRFCYGRDLLSALGLYQPLVDFAGAGATVPLTGFGHLLARGAIEGAQRGGLLGVFAGGLSAAAAGFTAAIVLGYFTALVFRPKG